MKSTTALAFVFGLVLQFAPLNADAKQKKDDDFDRFDGRGKSGVKVDVIDWAGNLEIHVTPKGSLAGLAMKTDRRNRSKPVMVIGYRFNHNPNHQYIRRALLTMPMNDNFNVFEDKNADGYDKIIISSHVLSGVTAYKLDKAPAHLYPAGHPLRKDEEEQRGIAGDSQDSKKPMTEKQRQALGQGNNKNQNQQDSGHSQQKKYDQSTGRVPRVTYGIKKRAPDEEKPKTYEDGAIKNFDF